MQYAIFLMLCFAMLGLHTPVAATEPGKEKLLFGLSQNQISITPNFSGTEITVYGAIERSGVLLTEPVDIIITLSSAPKSIAIRKKREVFNVWTNRDIMERVFAPNYYSIVSTRPLAYILPPEEIERHSIGIRDAIFVPNHADYQSLDVDSFVHALIRLRKQAGLYREALAGVTVKEDTLFHARLQLPRNIISGDYYVRIFLVKNERVQDVLTSDIYVRKAGIERILHELAHDKPLQYGVLCVVLSLIIGWGAFQLFSMRA